MSDLSDDFWPGLKRLSKISYNFWPGLKRLSKISCHLTKKLGGS
jgi:hypothetical protein